MDTASPSDQPDALAAMPPLPQTSARAAINPQVEADAIQPWPQRAWCLAILGGMIGCAIYLLTRLDEMGAAGGQLANVRDDAIVSLFVFGVIFAFTVERQSLKLCLGFAAAAGAVVGLAVYWNFPAFDSGSDGPWQIICALLSVAIATPLFQSWRANRERPSGEVAEESDTTAHRFVPAIPYAAAANHAWTGAVLGVSAAVFVGICWALAFLLGELFRLVRIDWLSDFLGEEIVIATLTGVMLGGGIGLLRDREAVLGLLQRVVTTVLGVLAPVLAVGLVAFLAVLPFTGLTSLWQATKSTTPILLVCIIGALCLINAVIGCGSEDEGGPDAPSSKRVLGTSAAALTIVILPLALIAAVSTGLRIQQYGLTPERLWALVFTAIATAYGVAYLGSILRSGLKSRSLSGTRQNYAAYLRTANLRLGLGLCVLALLLATPLINFGALSTRDQIARLHNGTTALEEFDWGALRFDFGPSGVAAIETLAASGKTPEIRAAAAKAQKAENRWALTSEQREATRPPMDPSKLTILPKVVPLPPALAGVLTSWEACKTDSVCTVFYEEGADEAVIVTNDNARRFVRFEKDGKEVWGARQATDIDAAAFVEDPADRIAAGGKAEVRTITMRQVFVDGKPVHSPFQ